MAVNQELLNKPVVMRDISNEQIDIGDYLVVVDQKNLTEIVGDVKNVKPDVQGTSGYIERPVVVKVVKSSIEAQVGRTLQINIPRSVRFEGAILSYREATRRITKVERNLLIAQECRRIVDSYAEKRAKFVEILDILTGRNLLTGSDANRRKVLGEAIQEFPELVKSKGGWVRSGKVTIDGYKEMQLGRKAIVVDFPRLTAGLRMVLTAFSCFELTGEHED